MANRRILSRTDRRLGPIASPTVRTVKAVQGRCKETERAGRDQDGLYLQLRSASKETPHDWGYLLRFSDTAHAIDADDRAWL